jgi:hypothetical protein
MKGAWLVSPQRSRLAPSRHVWGMHSILFWHSALPLQICACPCIELPWVGHEVAHAVPAVADVAVPQQTFPLGQSLSP